MIRSEPVATTETTEGDPEVTQRSDNAGSDSEDSDSDDTSDDVGSDDSSFTAVSLGEPFAPQPGPMNNAGIPSTLVAVTRDTHELVEIDAVDGGLVRSLGSIGADLEDTGNVIDSAWWHPATGVIVVSDGPEPAAGNLQLVAPGERFVGQGGAEGWGPGWDVAISPDGRFALTTGYGADVSVLADSTNGRDRVVDLLDGSDQDLRYHPAWLRDRAGVVMVREAGGARSIVEVIELGDDAQPLETISHELGREIADLEVRGDGKLVVLYDDGRNQSMGSRAVVVNPDSGEVEAEFDLEEGSHSLAYDATGTFLLYVDGAGTVRWRGGGSAGVVAEDYVHADW